MSLSCDPGTFSLALPTSLSHLPGIGVVGRVEGAFPAGLAGSGTWAPASIRSSRRRQRARAGGLGSAVPVAAVLTPARAVPGVRSDRRQTSVSRARSLPSSKSPSGRTEPAPVSSERQGDGRPHGSAEPRVAPRRPARSTGPAPPSDGAEAPAGQLCGESGLARFRS